MRDEFNVTPEYYGDIVIPAEVTYEGITYQVIGLMDCAFKNSNSVYNGKPALRSVTIEAPITEIPYKCFQFSDVEEVYLPPTITSFGNWSFDRCSKLKTVEIPPSAPLVSLGEGCFFECTELHTLNLPNCVLDIGKRAFESSGITYFEVPSSMTYIPENCFASSQLQEIIIPVSVNRLENQCFANTKLKEFDFPWSVNIIYGKEFYNCTELERITIHANVERIIDILKCPNLREIYVLRETPPDTGGWGNDGVFYGTYFRDIPDDKVLYVPAESVEAY